MASADVFTSLIRIRKPLHSLHGHAMDSAGNSREIRKIMDWIPIVFVMFKVLVLGTGMFFAIKWHYDQGKKDKDKKKEARAVLRASGKVAAIFVLALLVLGLVTFFLARTLGMDLTF